MSIPSRTRTFENGKISEPLQYGKTYADHAYETIREDIIEGKLRPNQRLVETTIARGLGFSRTPVREALVRLEMLGYVSALKKGGWIVTDHLPSQIRNLYEVREALEVMAIKLTCTRASKDVLAAADELNNKLSNAASTSDIVRYSQLNSEFHAVLFGSCGNEKLSSLIHSLRDQYFDRRVLLLFTKKEWNAMDTQHRRMLEAIREKNIKKAEKAVKDHIQTVKRVAMMKL